MRETCLAFSRTSRRCVVRRGLLRGEIKGRRGRLSTSGDLHFGIYGIENRMVWQCDGTTEENRSAR